MEKNAKRLLSAVICLVMVLSMLPVASFAADITVSAADAEPMPMEQTDPNELPTIVLPTLPEQTHTLFCQAPDEWTQCNVYWWGSEEAVEWPGAAMSADSDGIWYYDVPADATDVLFNNGSEQSEDQTIPTDDKVMFIYQTNTWDVYGRQEIVVNYYVAGTAALCGTSWEPADENNRMLDEDGDGIYTKVYENIPAGSYDLKVTDGSWKNTWGAEDGSGNFVLSLAVPAETIEIRFDSQTGLISAEITYREPLPTPPDPAQLVCYVAGTFNEWNCAAEGYLMTNNGDGTYSLDISVTTGAHSLKITDGTWDNSWGGDGENGNYDFSTYADGILSVTFDAVNSVITISGECLDVEMITLYCQTPGYWTECYAYWWGSAGENPVWPGLEMAVDSSGVWYIDVPVDSEYVIFNNGSGVKSPDLTVPTDAKLMYIYETGSWDIYGKQEIVKNYYVAGTFNDWTYDDALYQMTDNNDGTYTLDIAVSAGYYTLKVTDGTQENTWGANGAGDECIVEMGTDGILTVFFDSIKGTVTVSGESLEVEMITLFCQSPADWTQCYAYWWGSASENPQWPGLAMNVDRNGIWYIDIPVDVENIVFNNGEGSQSMDLTVPVDDKIMYAYENMMWDVYGWQENVGHYYVAGSFNGWNTAADDYRMTDNGDGTFTLDVELTAGSYSLKVTDGSWNNSWGGTGNNGEYDIVVATDGTVTVTFDAVNYVVTVTGDCLEEIVQQPLDIQSIHAVGAEGLMGVEWNASANEVTGENGIYTVTFTGIDVGIYDFKFAANGGWELNWGTNIMMESGVEYDAWLGGGNGYINVSQDNATVTLTLDLSAMDAYTGEGAKCTAAVAYGQTVSGTVTAAGTVSVELSGENGSYTATTEDGTYSIESVAAGTYTLSISAEGYVTYTCEITVGTEAVTQNVKLHIKGDITGDGKVNVMDVARIYTHAKGGKQLTGYAFACADLTGDGKVNVMDTARAYKIAKT